MGGERERERERERDGFRQHSHQTHTHKTTKGVKDGGSGSDEGKVKGLTRSDALASIAIKEAWAGAAVEAFAGRRQVKASHPGEARAAQTRVQFCSREPKHAGQGSSLDIRHPVNHVSRITAKHKSPTSYLACIVCTSKHGCQTPSTGLRHLEECAGKRCSKCARMSVGCG